MAKNYYTIGIDARFYGPVGKGLGRYAQEVIDRLLVLDQTNHYVVFLTKDNFDVFYTDNPRVKKVLADVRWYSWDEQFKMPKIIDNELLDLMHYLHFNVPFLARTPFVVTIHDLILYRYPTVRASTLYPIYYWFKNMAYRLIINMAVRRSRKIIAVSEFTKQDIIKQFNVNPDKVAVTYEGIATFAETTAAQADSQAVLARLTINKPYLLYVGNAYPHKNLEWLINSLADSNLQDINLVLVGREDYFYKRLKELAATKSQPDKFIFPGFVTDKDLKVLYQQALAYVFPSFYEGFGLPPLEAMALGCPVLSARTSSLPEVLGAAALYFDPQDQQSLLAVIDQMLNNEPLRQQMIVLGKARSNVFSWQECAAKTLAIYNKLCARS
ncbi:MAG: glycosyltransferase family 1 protein [Candidatus Falkowbacteria bacterium]